MQTSALLAGCHGEFTPRPWRPSSWTAGSPWDHRVGSRAVCCGFVRSRRDLAAMRTTPENRLCHGEDRLVEPERRGRDSNPREKLSASLAAFKAAAFDRSATPPGAWLSQMIGR